MCHDNRYQREILSIIIPAALSLSKDLLFKTFKLYNISKLLHPVSTILVFVILSLLAIVIISIIMIITLMIHIHICCDIEFLFSPTLVIGNDVILLIVTCV